MSHHHIHPYIVQEIAFVLSLAPVAALMAVAFIRPRRPVAGR